MMWIRVVVEHIETGLTGEHFVQVPKSLVRPEDNAKAKEQDRLDTSRPGEFRVVNANRW